MKKLIAVLALSLVGCASHQNVRVLNDNPPFCQDYILTDPVTGESWLCYNSASGQTTRIPIKPTAGR